MMQVVVGTAVRMAVKNAPELVILTVVTRHLHSLACNQYDELEGLSSHAFLETRWEWWRTGRACPDLPEYQAPTFVTRK